jgi:SAM-dependent methyltransferase
MDATYAHEYRRLYEGHWWWRARRGVILAELARRVGPRRGLTRRRQTILDVGCGDGLFFDDLCRLGDVEGVEVDDSLVAPDGPWRSRIHVCPFDERFQPGRRYSLILMLDVLEHLSDPVAALSHARDLLTGDGTLLITVPALRLLWTAHDDMNHHYTRYTKRSFRRVAEPAGLWIEQLRYLFQWTCPVKLAVRVKETLFGSAPGPPHVPPPPINAMLYGLCRVEHAVLGRMAPPFGSSLLAVCGKRGS